MQEPTRDLAALVVPQVGRVVGTDDPWELYRLVGADGVVVGSVAAYLRDLQAAGRPVGDDGSLVLLGLVAVVPVLVGH